MSQAFVIMQIGNIELDKIYEEAIAPAIRGCELEPKRVDKHNEGGLLKSEIINFIQESPIIIADLTNERPNCYLEIGYAMGIDKFKNLILTVKENHFSESPNYVHGGPKIHFDLAGYDILAWKPDAIPEFRADLERKIKRRQLIISPTIKKSESIWDTEWVEKHRTKAKSGIKDIGLQGYMEVRFTLRPPKLRKSQSELNEAARVSTIDTFGWPIGVYLGNRDEFSPRPTSEGIVAEIPSTEYEKSYDYWTIKKTGDFYLLSSFFEDQRGRSEEIFFNTRIVRITEVLLYCARLYSTLGVNGSQIVHLAIKHSGIQGRTLTSSNPARHLRSRSKSIENQVEEEITFALQEVESKLVDLVKQLTKPLFMMFDFFELADSVFEDLVDKFVGGRCD